MIDNITLLVIVGILGVLTVLPTTVGLYKANWWALMTIAGRLRRWRRKRKNRRKV